ncbi:hypothetical protein ABPG72_017255 [Tetrahymena utriculariae]
MLCDQKNSNNSLVIMIKQDYYDNSFSQFKNQINEEYNQTENILKHFQKYATFYISSFHGVGKSKQIEKDIKKERQNNEVVIKFSINGNSNKQSLIQQLQQNMSEELKEKNFFHIDLYESEEIDLNFRLFEIIFLKTINFNQRECINLGLQSVFYFEINNSVLQSLENKIKIKKHFMVKEIKFDLDNLDIEILNENGLKEQALKTFKYLQGLKNQMQCKDYFDNQKKLEDFEKIQEIQNKVFKQLLDDFYIKYLKNQKIVPNFQQVVNFISLFGNEMMRFEKSQYVSFQDTQELKSQLRTDIVTLSFKMCQRISMSCMQEDNKLGNCYDTNIQQIQSKQAEKLLKFRDLLINFVTFQEQEIPCLTSFFINKEEIPKSLYTQYQKYKKTILVFDNNSRNNANYKNWLITLFNKNEDTFYKNRGNGNNQEFQNYVENLTIQQDNFFKISAIYLRIRSNIPIILMGETGIGKTALIQFLTYVMNDIGCPKQNVHLIHIFNKANINQLNINDYTNIEQSYKNQQLDFIRSQQIYQIIDENQKYIQDILDMDILFGTPYTFKYKPIHSGVTERDIIDMIQSSENEILQQQNTNGQTSNKKIILFFDEVNTSNLISGLFKEIIVDRSLKGKKFHNNIVLIDAINPYQLKTDNQYKMDQSEKNIVKYAAYLAFYINYCLMIPKEKNRVVYLSELCQLETSFTHKELTEFIKETENFFIGQLEVPQNVVKNISFKQNALLFFFCIVNRVPVCLIGPPGCSKSLSLKCLISSMKGKKSKKEFLLQYPALVDIQFQGHTQTKSQNIIEVFQEAEKRQDNLNQIQQQQYQVVICFEEIGLAEISPDNPLKVLHEQLEKNKVAFVSISNWPLDASKMNRMISIYRQIDQDSHQQTTMNECFILQQAFFRNLSGLKDSKEIFQDLFKFIKNNLKISYNPLELIKQNLNESQSEFVSRHLIIITNDEQKSLLFLQEYLKDKKQKFFCGMSFPQEQGEQHKNNIINQIIGCIKEGFIVIVQNLDGIYQSFYEILNQSYFKLSKVFVGAEQCPIEVNNSFQFILVVNEIYVSRMDGPLLNRFEKHYLNSCDILNNQDKSQIKDITEQVNKYQQEIKLRIQNKYQNQAEIQLDNISFKFKKLDSLIEDLYLQCKLKSLSNQVPKEMILTKLFHLSNFQNIILSVNENFGECQILNELHKIYVESGFHQSLNNFIQKRIIDKKTTEDFNQIEKFVIFTSSSSIFEYKSNNDQYYIDINEIQSNQQFNSLNQPLNAEKSKQKILLINTYLSNQNQETKENILNIIQNLVEQIVEKKQENRLKNIYLNIIIIVGVEEQFEMIPIKGEWEYYYIEDLSPLRQYEYIISDPKLFTDIRNNFCLKNLIQNKQLYMYQLFSINILIDFFLSYDFQLIEEAYSKINYNAQVNLNNYKSNFMLEGSQNFERFGINGKKAEENLVDFQKLVIQFPNLILVDSKNKQCSYIEEEYIKITKLILRIDEDNKVEQQQFYLIKIYLVWYIWRQQIEVISNIISNFKNKFQLEVKLQMCEQQNKISQSLEQLSVQLINFIYDFIKESGIFELYCSLENTIYQLQNVQVENNQISKILEYVLLINHIKDSLQEIPEVKKLLPQINVYSFIKLDRLQLKQAQNLSNELINLIYDSIKESGIFELQNSLKTSIYQLQNVQIENNQISKILEYVLLINHIMNNFQEMTEVKKLLPQINVQDLIKLDSIQLNQAKNLLNELIILIYDSIKESGIFELYYSLENSIYQLQNVQIKNNQISEILEYVQLINHIKNNFQEIPEIQKLLLQINVQDLIKLNRLKLKQAKNLLNESFQNSQKDKLELNQIKNNFNVKWNQLMKKLIILSIQNRKTTEIGPNFIHQIFKLEKNQDIGIDNMVKNTQFQIFLHRVFFLLSNSLQIENQLMLFHNSFGQYTENIFQCKQPFYTFLAYGQILQNKLLKKVSLEKICMQFFDTISKNIFKSLNILQQTIYLSYFKVIVEKILDYVNLEESQFTKKESTQEQEIFQNQLTLDEQILKYFSELNEQAFQLFIVIQLFCKQQLKNFQKLYYFKYCKWLQKYTVLSQYDIQQYINMNGYDLVNEQNAMEHVQQIIQSNIQSSNNIFKNMYVGVINNNQVYLFNMKHPIESEIDLYNTNILDATKNLYQCLRCDNFIVFDINEKFLATPRCIYCQININLNDKQNLKLVLEDLSNKELFLSKINIKKGFCQHLSDKECLKSENLDIKNFSKALFALVYFCILDLSLKLQNSPFNKKVIVNLKDTSKEQLQKQQTFFINQVLLLAPQKQAKDYLNDQIQLALKIYQKYTKQKLQVTQIKSWYILHNMVKYILSLNLEFTENLNNSESLNEKITTGIQTQIEKLKGDYYILDILNDKIYAESLHTFIKFYHDFLNIFSFRFEYNKVQNITFKQQKKEYDTLKQEFATFIYQYNKLIKQIKSKSSNKEFQNINEINEDTILLDLLYTNQNKPTNFFVLLNYLCEYQNKQIEQLFSLCEKNNNNSNVQKLYQELKVQLLDETDQIIKKPLQCISISQVIDSANYQDLEQFATLGFEEGDGNNFNVIFDFDSLQYELSKAAFMNVSLIDIEKTAQLQFLDPLEQILKQKFNYFQELLPDQIKHLDQIIIDKDNAFDILQQITKAQKIIDFDQESQPETSILSAMESLRIRFQHKKISLFLEQIKLKHLKAFINYIQDKVMDKLVNYCDQTFRSNSNLQNIETFIQNFAQNQRFLKQLRKIIGRFIIKVFSQDKTSYLKGENLIQSLKEEKIIQNDHQIVQEESLKFLKIEDCFLLFEKIQLAINNLGSQEAPSQSQNYQRLLIEEGRDD